MIGDRLEAADVALTNNGKATTTHGEAQDGCCVARTRGQNLWPMWLPHSPTIPAGGERLTHMAPLASQGSRDKFVQCTMPVEPGQDDQGFHCKVKIWHSWGQYLGHEPKAAILG